MRTYLTFKLTNLIKRLNSRDSFYSITERENNLNIIKNYVNKKGRPFSITLPRIIRISPETVGLIVGEGFIGDRSFVFANSNEKAIDEVLELLKQFKTPIKYYLEISIKNKSRKFINDSKIFWEKYLDLHINKIRLRKEFHNITNHGTLHIGLNNKLIVELLREIINISKKKIEKSKPLSAEYLKGILAAEGNINIKKSTSCVYMVRISASKQEEREHYRKCLENIGINVTCKDMLTVSKEEAKQKGWKTTKGRAGAVLISKWDNFIKILELDLLSLSDDKKQKFLKHLLNNKFTKQFLNFKYFLNKEFTMKDAQNHFNFSGRHLNRVSTFWKKGYISRKRINKVKFLYKLTKKYCKVYDILTSYQNNPTF